MRAVIVCYAMLYMVQHLQCPYADELDKPKNISCKIFDFIKMVCTWDPFCPSLRTNWTLRYGFQCYRKCSFVKTQKLNHNQKKLEIWNEDSESAYRLYCDKCVQIIGKSNTEIIKSDVMKFVPEYIVELSPVNITNIQVTDSNIYIEWKQPMIQRPTICYVRYASGLSPLHTKTKWNNRTDIQLTELSPSTMYRIWISWKFETSTFWSNEKYLNARTNHAALKSGPVILQGAYLKYKCLQPNQTCFTLYWKPLQGSLATTEFYEISNCLPRENVHCNPKRVGANKNCLEMNGPDFPIKYIFIRAKTEIGYSPYSTLMLNQDELVPQKVKNVRVEETKDQQVLSISWSYEGRNSTKSPVTNVTILWCHGEKTFTDALVVNCEDQIDWITVVANGSYKLRLGAAIDIHRFHIAIILNSKAGSQEMTWSECIFTQTGRISDLQLPLLITTFPEKILVQWYPVQCRITIFPLIYQLAYTRQSQNWTQNPCELGSLVNVSISHTKVELKNLQHNEFYYICIRIMTVIGPTPFSKPYLEKTSVLSTKTITIQPNTYSVNTSTTQRVHRIIKNVKEFPQAITIGTCMIAVTLFIIFSLWYLWKQCYFTIEIVTPKIIKTEYEECSTNDGSSNDLDATKYEHDI